MHNDGGSSQEVTWRIDLAHGIVDSFKMSIWRSRHLCRRTKIWIFKSLVILVLLYGCETWTLNTNLKRRIDVFGTRCLCRIMGYRWNDIGSNLRSCRELLPSLVGLAMVLLWPWAQRRKIVYWIGYLRQMGKPKPKRQSPWIVWTTQLHYYSTQLHTLYLAILKIN